MAECVTDVTYKRARHQNENHQNACSFFGLLLNPYSLLFTPPYSSLLLLTPPYSSLFSLFLLILLILLIPPYSSFFLPPTSFL